MRHALLPLFVLAVTACGPGNTFTGTVESTSFSPKDAISVLTVDDSTGNQTLTILMGDVTGLCALSQAAESPANGTLMVLVVGAFDSDNNPLPLETGTYPVLTEATVSGNQSLGLFDKLDASCGSSLSSTAITTDGSVTLSQLTVGTDTVSAQGSFSLSFGSDAVTGTFSASACANVSPSQSTTCH